MSDSPGILNSPSIISCLKDLHVPKEKEHASRYNKVITDFINKKKVPFWYKELSERQMTSGYELLNNLRDDTQQDTTHRTKLNLQLLGLCPIPTTSQIKIAMQWSQGNDLAFLWFILELYYANLDQLLDAEDSTYDSNQQILMSTIVHLDMIPTLRELDRILPKPKKQAEISKKLSKVKPTPKKAKLRQSPYLQIIPPWPAEEKSPKGEAQEPKPCFEPYDLYTDSNYICPNELNRWYADPEQVGLILDNCNGSDDRYNTGEDQKNSDRLENCEMGMGDRMCSQLGDVEEFRKSLTYKLKLAVQNRCEKFLHDNDRSEENRDKFLHELEGDIRDIEEQFDKLSERFQTQKWLPQLINELLTKTIDMKDVSLCNKILSCAMDHKLFGDVIKMAKRKSEGCEKIMFDYGHNGKVKANEKYFLRPNARRPYIFDYARIFSHRTHSSNFDLNTKVDCIKNAIEQALEYKKYDNEDDAILGCLEEMWEYETNQLSNQNEKRKPKLNDFNDNSNDASNPILTFDKKIDPKNEEQMRKLLISAISEMKKNPKFVMVQLPQVHNLEILKLWVKARYGYRISQHQRDKALRGTKAVYDEIKRLKIKIPIPTVSDITTESHFDYKDKKQLHEKAQILLHTYFSALKSEVLKRTQIYWHCMEPTHLKKGPPREVFFSYMPAKPQDILPFKPWENDDYVDARSEHEKRLALKKLN